jgi:hypothetical protein
MKRAFIVTGPESSGTRLMANILEAGGCIRDDDMKSGAETMVIHRSVPHGGIMPDFAGMVNRLRGGGYTVQAVVMIRDPFTTASSQVQTRHSADLEQAYSKQRTALVFILQQLDQCRCPFLHITYETLVQRPAEIQRRIAAFLKLDIVPQIGVYDGNEKYYEA